MDEVVGQPGFVAVGAPAAFQDEAVVDLGQYQCDVDVEAVVDVFTPDGAKGKKLPVLLFVHGGGFTRGDKHGDFYPDNITLWAAKNGMVGVNIDYRLAPMDPWPAGVKDLASSIAWTKANIARYGGDPNNIVLFGHSAGANHVADYAAHPEVRGAEASSVKGVILLSPAYSTAPGGRPNSYYGQDADLGSASGQITRLTASPYTLFYGYAEFDPQPMKATATALIEGVCQTKSRCPKSVELKDSNHFSEGMAIGTPDQQLTGPLLQWIKALTAKGYSLDSALGIHLPEPVSLIIGTIALIVGVSATLASRSPQPDTQTQTA